MVNHANDSEPSLSAQSDGRPSRPVGPACRLRWAGNHLEAELVAISEVCARVRVVQGHEGFGPGEVVELEIGPSGEAGPALCITGFIIDQLGDMLWLRFSGQLEAELLDMQPSLGTCTMA